MVFFSKLACASLLVASALAAPQLSFGSIQSTALPLSVSGIEEEPFDPNPSYTYSYQISSDDTQTYIAQNENRDNGVVNGEYSYVDPLGALITVTYSAGPDGYTESRNVQDGFVAIRSNNVGGGSSAGSISSSSAVVSAAPVVQAIRRPVSTATTSTSSSSSTNSDALLSQITSSLLPFIRETVSSSLNNRATTTSTTSTSTPIRRVVSSAPIRRVVSTIPAPSTSTSSTSSSSGTRSSSSSSSVSSIFGTGGANNVRFSAPEFNYAFDLNAAPAN